MSPSTSSVRVSRYRLAVAVVVTGLLLVLFVVSDEPLHPALVVLVFVAGFLFASAFDAVREHPLYHVANTAWVILFGLLWYLTVNRGDLVVLAFVALALLGLLVELYNYYHGTSYLRIDL